MINVNVMTLENGQNYIIFDTLEDGDNRYIFFVSENNNFDICIRKVVQKDNKEWVTKLDNKEEFDNVIKLYQKKYERVDKND